MSKRGARAGARRARPGVRRGRRRRRRPPGPDGRPYTGEGRIRALTRAPRAGHSSFSDAAGPEQGTDEENAMTNAENARPALRQPPTAYRSRVGDIEIVAANDGMVRVPMKDGFVRGVTAAEVGEALAESGLPREILTITFTPIVVRTGGETVLVDTGYGASGPPTAGFLLENLAAGGVRPEDVTKVVISHFHGDHINGLLTKDGALVYPNAEILVPAPEWDFWTSQDRKAQAPDAMKAAFDNVARVLGPMKDRLTHYKWDQEVAPGMIALDANGHTPGHTAFAISSDGESFVFISDTTNHPALFVRNPDWSPSFDIDPDAARRTKRRILDMVVTDDLPVGGFHFPFPALGKIARDGERYRYLPAQWMAVV
ncbi:MAG: MBL fold metallo-hydrolase [Salinarimonadaceae bacterium]|nr:MAG: MBL fold metallo-hydrolase [Salinarimonadaceae bacterium]